MIKEFRDFILRGNVVELAVAVVIGVAFTAVVAAIVDNLITPVIAAIGGTNPTGLAFHIIKSNDATIINFGNVIGAVITFLITAAVVFFVFVKPLNNIAARFAPKPEDPATPPDVALLTEIRDLLRTQNRT